MWKSFLCGFRNRKKNKVLARIAIEFSQSKHGAVWEPLKYWAWAWRKSK